jgi:predicted ribosomally synthesized peptide with nif11-like leader
MSQEAVREFWKKVNQDKALAQAFDSLLATDGQRHVAHASAIVELAARSGFEFTVDELKAHLKSAPELSDHELAGAVGGAKWFVPDMDSDQSGMAIEKIEIAVKVPGRGAGFVVF